MNPRHRRLVVSLYLLAGLPLGMFSEAVPAYMRLHGRSLAEIGWLGVLQLPWSFKWLWGPLVDRVATPRAWLAAGIVPLALVPVGFAALDERQALPAMLALLALMGIGSAVYDVTADAIFLRSVAGAIGGSVAAANRARLIAYKAAMMIGGGGLVLAAGAVGWPPAFMGVAALIVLCAATAPWQALAPGPAPANSIAWRAFWAELVAWGACPQNRRTFLFVFVYKASVVSVMAMDKVFWVDQGYSAAAMGAAGLALGGVGTLVGAVLGTAIVARWGLAVGLSAGSGVQAIAALGYAATCAGVTDVVHLPLLWLSAGATYLALGLSTTAMMNLVTAVCQVGQAATQFALVTALYSLTRVVCGTGSPLFTAALGYRSFFLGAAGLSFLGAIALAWLWRGDGGMPLRARWGAPRRGC